MKLDAAMVFSHLQNPENAFNDRTWWEICTPRNGEKHHQFASVLGHSI
jgi:hypothetical protein